MRYKKIEVSDHAIIRYLERIKGVDFEILKKEIVDDSMMKFINKLGGSGKFPKSDDFEVVVRNYKIITIIKNKIKTKK
jgi:hypothetical protein